MGPSGSPSGREPAAEESAPRPISARRAATRNRLLAAAKQVFSERGIHGAAVEDICDAAGFTRGAFYSNFDSKQELMAALLHSEHSQVMDRVTTVLNQELARGSEPGADPADVVDQIVERFLAASPLDRPSLLLRGEFRQAALRDPWAANLLLQKDDEVRDELTSLVVAALGTAGRRLVVDVDDAVRTIIAVFEAAILEVLLREDDSPVSAAPFRRSLTLVLRAFSEPL